MVVIIPYLPIGFMRSISWKESHPVNPKPFFGNIKYYSYLCGMEEIAIEVRYRQQDSKSYFDIRFPKGQPLISVKNSTGILAAAISLLIKAGHKSGEIKDYELLETIIEYMKSEFTSTESFEDAEIQPNTFKK